MNGINPPRGFIPQGNIPVNYNGQGIANPYNIRPVNVPNQLVAGAGLDATLLANRGVSTHPSSMYMNVSPTITAASGQLQDSLNLRGQSGMYAGMLDGVHNFTNCVININNGRSDLVPPMNQQPFRLLHMRSALGAQPVQVPLQTLAQPLSALPSDFGQGSAAVYGQMLAVCQAQILQLENNIAVLQNQLSVLGQSLMPTPSMQNSIQPFMVPMPQVIANIQAVSGMGGIGMPALQGYPVQAQQGINMAGPFGQFYLEPIIQQPFDMTSLEALCPNFEKTPMQNMSGWDAFAAGFSSFLPPGSIQMPGSYGGAPLLYMPEHAQNNGTDNDIFQEPNLPGYDQEQASNKLGEELSEEGDVLEEEEGAEDIRTVKELKEKQQQIEDLLNEMKIKQNDDSVSTVSNPELSRPEPEEGLSYSEWQDQLVNCCQQGDKEALIKVLKIKQPKFNLNDCLERLDGLSPLMFLCKQGISDELVDMLMKEGCDLRAETDDGESAFILAASSPGKKGYKIINLMAKRKDKLVISESELINALKVSSKLKQNFTIFAVISYVEESKREEYLAKAGLKRGDFKPERFNDILGVDPDAIPSRALESYNSFLQSCKKCEYQEAKKYLSELRRLWPEYTVSKDYRETNPIRKTCEAHQVGLNKKMVMIHFLKEELADDLGVSDYKLYKRIHFEEYEKKLPEDALANKDILKMVLHAPTTKELKTKLNQYENDGRHDLAEPTSQQLILKKLMIMKGEGWPDDLINTNELKLWHKLEARAYVDSEDGAFKVIPQLDKALNTVKKQQHQNEKVSIEQELMFLQDKDKNSKVVLRPFAFFSTIPHGVAAIKGESPLKKLLPVCCDHNIKGKDTEFDVLALFDPKGKKGEILAKYVTDDLKKKLTNVLSSSEDEDDISEKLKIAVEELDYTLSGFGDITESGLEGTIAISWKKKNGELVILTATLGDAATILLHPDGEAEQLSLATSKQKRIGFHCAGTNKSVRSKITRKVLPAGTDKKSIQLIQLSGALRSKATPSAISELARKNQENVQFKSIVTHEKEPPPTLELAMKNEKKQITKTERKFDSFSYKPITSQKFAEEIVQHASDDKSGGHLLALVKTFGSNNTLKTDELSSRTISNRLRLMPRNNDGRHSAEQIDDFAIEIEDRCKTDDEEKNKLLTCLYIDLTTNYDELDLVPKRLDEYITKETSISQIIKTKNKKELKKHTCSTPIEKEVLRQKLKRMEMLRVTDDANSGGNDGVDGFNNRVLFDKLHNTSKQSDREKDMDRVVDLFTDMPGNVVYNSKEGVAPDSWDDRKMVKVENGGGKTLLEPIEFLRDIKDRVNKGNAREEQNYKVHMHERKFIDKYDNGANIVEKFMDANYSEEEMKVLVKLFPSKEVSRYFVELNDNILSASSLLHYDDKGCLIEQDPENKFYLRRIENLKNLRSALAVDTAQLYIKNKKYPPDVIMALLEYMPEKYYRDIIYGSIYGIFSAKDNQKSPDIAVDKFIKAFKRKGFSLSLEEMEKLKLLECTKPLSENKQMFVNDEEIKMTLDPQLNKLIDKINGKPENVGLLEFYASQGVSFTDEDAVQLDSKDDVQTNLVRWISSPLIRIAAEVDDIKVFERIFEVCKYEHNVTIKWCEGWIKELQGRLEPESRMYVAAKKGNLTTAISCIESHKKELQFRECLYDLADPCNVISYDKMQKIIQSVDPWWNPDGKSKLDKGGSLLAQAAIAGQRDAVDAIVDKLRNEVKSVGIGLDGFNSQSITLLQKEVADKMPNNHVYIVKKLDDLVLHLREKESSRFDY